jgi:hypothetical protein
MHKGADHTFVAAKYIFLSGEDTYSPNNKEAVDAEQRASNKDGDQIKVIIGSQVTEKVLT